MTALLDDVRFAFQPLFNLHTGGVVAIEALARPSDRSAYELLRDAARAGVLLETDAALAAAAVRAAAERDTLLPLHINLLAATAAKAAEAVGPLLEALQETGRRAEDVWLEIGTPFSRLRRDALFTGLDLLRMSGFHLVLDGVGDGDVPLSLYTELAPEMIKLDRRVVAGLAEDPGKAALVTALTVLCEHNQGQLVAEGVETELQLAAVRRLGFGLAQGNLLAPASRRPAVDATISPTLTKLPEHEMTGPVRRAAGPRVTDFLHPATALSVEATAEEVRAVFANQAAVSGVVLVDEQGRPSWTVDRNRFLLAVTGPYGHALHAKREAARLADPPYIVPTDATALDLLDLLAHAERSRMSDEVVVVDKNDRCLGVVRVSDVVRGIAEMKVEQAAALNPLTRLPGNDALAREVDRRIAAREIFAVGWLDVDGFKIVNDSAGFAAGDDLIREIGRGLADAAAVLPTVQVGHIGGDDFVFVTGLDDLVPLSSGQLDTPRSAGGMAVSMSLATLVCATGSVADYREVSRLLAPLKKQAKALRGSSWVLGRPGSDRMDVLRGTAPASAVPPAQRGAVSA
ncbi:EAL domain-containing protein (putative c-di-GMP-specific phosphodiesterase class I)/GGDEF domain-containing protein [Kutzneria viridogrisea]|uniref:Diguanylate cyclase/phosphodiesterase n=2 Tax=Kutzneria TaxID=43356 RepID=W5W969_9PSEU|nr:GGDEF domain-containing protein [Kutzneria albida]AHH97106.1 diguanylate cyclase/phosphodiesterase [Kutzneria albida DSM 43870]MBA8931923.1 EAL domain-containing protein (putative c-di-GMP-specific phosphodiesterase class I)/GGDEF domain-containing protein [Kutzneria viridogrisea]